MTANAPLADQCDRDRAVRELDTSFLVEAAAGTGKTTLLIDRIMALLEAGRARLPEIVAITFTEKAAGELKLRLRQAIERKLRGSGPTAGDVWRRALSEVDATRIGTIHSFCADLIRERPVEAGVEPGFAVGDELTTQLLFRDAWDRWLAEQMTPDNTPLRRAIRYGVGYQDTPNGPSSLFRLASFLNEHRDLLGVVAPERPLGDADLARAAEALDSIAADLVRLAASFAKVDSDAGVAQINRIDDWIRSRRSTDLDALVGWIEAAPGVRRTAGNQTNWKPRRALREVKELFARFSSGLENLRSELGHRIVWDLLTWARPFLERYAEAKAARRLLDFQDLLLRARDMLKNHSAAREHFKRTYRYILVDEFQDTDPLQTEIVFFLCEQPGERADDWESVRLAPGKLFMVGDPKQSIYGFRRADLQLYARVKRLMERSGRILSLRVNFRSAPPVTEEVNALFRRLMRGPEEGRFEPEHVDLVPWRTASNAGEGVCLLVPPPSLKDDDLNARAWRRRESGAIAAYIRRLVERGESIHDQDTGTRPIRFGDIGILLRNTSALELLENALRAHDVPYEVSGGKYYYARREFQDLLTVLRAIENPYDAFSIVHALRSPFFGQSDEDLLAHFAAGGAFSYLEPTPRDCQRLANAFVVLEELHRVRNEWPPGRVLDELFQRTQALQIYAMKPHGEQRVANLLKVKDLARDLSEAAPMTFAGLVRWLARMETMEEAEPESPVAEPKDDFVRVMTFHKAKGLEFPVVILAHLAAQGRKQLTHVIDRENGRLALNLASSVRTADWETALELQRMKDDGEARRLLYVAMTRARDRLILPLYWCDDHESEFVKFLRERYAPSENGPTPGGGAHIVIADPDEIVRETRDAFAVPLPPEGPPSPAALAYHADRREWLERVRRRVDSLCRPSSVAAATELAAEESVSGGAADPEAAAFGSLVHRLLELVDFHETDDLELLAAHEAERAGYPPDLARRASALVRRTLATDFFRQRVARARRLYREVPFVTSHEGALVEGRMDMVLIEDDGAVLVDYKTDRVTPREMTQHARRYEPQLRAYAEALRTVLGRPVKEAVVFFVHDGAAISVPIGRARASAL